MKTFIFSFVLFFSASFSFAINYSAFAMSCPAPQNVTKVAEDSSSISFDWNNCCTGQYFQVYYIKDGNQSAVYSTSNSEFNFSNLTEGTYEFYFHSNCGGVLSAPIIVVDDIIIG